MTINQKIISLISLLLLLALFSCTVQDSTVASNKEEGIIYVNLKNSTEEGQIFINNKPTNYRTPTKIKLLPGTYKINVFLPGYTEKPDSARVILSENEVQEVNFEVESVPTGKLKVSTNVNNFKIWIDNLLYNFDNSDVMRLKEGSHNIKVQKPGYFTKTQKINIGQNKLYDLNISLIPKSKIYLVEHFSNVNCQPRAERDEDLRNYINQHDSIEILTISYHTKFPSEQDPFYLAAKKYNQGRVDYYDIISTPSYLISGDFISSLSRDKLQEGLNNYINSNSDKENVEQFHIQIDQYTNQVGGNVYYRSNSNSTNNYTLKIALIEKQINYLSPPGTNGTKNFHNILRDMYPDHSGSKAKLNKQKQRHEFSFNTQGTLQNNHQIIAFVQNEENKNIVAVTTSEIF